MSYIPAINGQVDSNNSTSTILTANSVFTGTSTEVVLYSSIAISVFSNVASASGGLSLQFSSNNTNWDYIKTYTISANNIENHIIPVTSRYFRIVYTNGSTNQTSFRLQTILHPEKNKNLTKSVSDTISYSNTDCTITNSVVNGITQNTNYISPLQIDEQGRLQVKVTGPASSFGDFRVQNPVPTCQVDFVYGINTNITKTALVASGTVTGSNGKAVIASGAAINSSGTLTSYDYLKYRDGQGALARFTALFTSGVSGNTQIAGVGTSNDGYFFGYNGTSFGILFRSSSTGSVVNTWIPQANWNIDVMDGSSSSSNKSGILLDPTKGNVYEITYTFLGFCNIYFYIVNQFTGLPTRVHMIQYSNSNTSLSTRNPSFPLLWQSANTTNNTNITVSAGSGALFNEGIIRYLGARYGRDNNKAITGTLTPLLSIQNVTTFNSITNQSQIKMRMMSIGTITTNAAVTTFQVVLNPTLTGASFTNIDSTNSITTVDTSATTTSGGTIVFNMVCGSGSSNIINMTDLDISINPGDILLFAAKSTANTTAAVAINWSEDI